MHFDKLGVGKTGVFLREKWWRLSEDQLKATLCCSSNQFVLNCNSIFEVVS